MPKLLPTPSCEAAKDRMVSFAGFLMALPMRWMTSSAHAQIQPCSPTSASAGTAGHAIVSGTVPYEITFTYADGSVNALTCGCYETGLCKHGTAVLLQLRETLEKIHEHWPDALAEDGYFAAVSKSAFSFFTTSSSKPASITLT